MGTGNSDRSVVVTHDLSQELCSGKHWKSLLDSTCILRIVRMYCCCINNNLKVISDVGSTLAIENMCTFGFQHFGQRAFFGIRSGNSESFFQKNLGKSTHTDTANTDKMDIKRFMKVYLIHSIISLYLIG